MMDTPPEDHSLFDHVTCNISASVDEATIHGALALDLHEQAEVEVGRLDQLNSSRMDESVCNENISRRKLDFGGDNENQYLDGISVEAHKVVCPVNILEDKIPKIGMEFDSEEAAYQFYNEYAKGVGFSIRKHYFHRYIDGKIIDRVFCCDHQGRRGKDKREVLVKSHRPETRTGCCAEMKISCRHTCKYTVINFTAEHKGHELVSPKKAHMLRSHRRMTDVQASQADDLDWSGIAPRASFAFISKQVGGRENVGFMLNDYKNYLRSKRTMEMKIGESGGVMEYLQQRQIDDPYFFYAVQLDADDFITNISWVDSRMKYDYTCFGDVVCFDTTYKKNKEGRPFAMFVGVNHHKQSIVFGAALLYDETASTFVWLFDTFTKAMSGKEPMTILTDQDAAMAKALSQQWPRTCHRLCIWHIYQNAATHLSNVFASFTDFSKDFTSCIYDYEEEEEFLNGWQKMLDKYCLQTNEWLSRLFNIREKWALVYGRLTFCADMTTTQRSESMHSVLKRYVRYKTNVLQFFHHFDRLVADRRYDELKADLMMSQSSPTIAFPIQILKHAATIYTHEVFELFQDELRKAYDSKLELCGENGDTFEYKVIPFRKKCSHTVLLRSQSMVSCSCKKFEFAGIICSHVLKVFSWTNTMEIPSQYINRRWTKKANKISFGAQSEEVCQDFSEFVTEDDEKKLTGIQYRELCSLSYQLTTRAALSRDKFQIARKGLCRLIEEVEGSPDKPTSMNTHLGPKSVVEKVIMSRSAGDVQGLGEIMVKGLKQKEKNPTRSGKRLKNGLEKNQKKRKRSSVITQKNDQRFEVNGNNLSMSHSAEPSSLSYVSRIQYPQVHQNGSSLTQLLQQQERFGEF